MLNIVVVFCGFLIAVVLARIIIPRILIISLRKRLFDTPDARKVHKRPVSRLGGVSFFPVILFTGTFLIGICYMTRWVSLVDIARHWVQILFMCTGLTLLFIVGIADDLIGVRYRQKFLVQLIAASMFRRCWYCFCIWSYLREHGCSGCNHSRCSSRYYGQHHGFLNRWPGCSFPDFPSRSEI